MAELFAQAGWMVHLVDTDRDLLHRLRCAGRFTIHKHLPAPVDVVLRCPPVSGPEEPGCGEAVMTAAVVAICVFPRDLPGVAQALAPLLLRRCRANLVSPLTVLLCLNSGDSVEQLAGLLRKAFSAAGMDWPHWLTLSDTVVRRTCIEDRENPLDLHTNGYPQLFFQQGKPGGLTGIPGCRPVPNLAAQKRIKLYTYNLVHAVYAYAGYQKGYLYLHQSHEDAEIRGLAKSALGESMMALGQESGLSESFLGEYEAELWRYAVLPQMPDEIGRVAWDPVRKLAPGERLVGPACLCMAQGVEPVSIVRAMAMALRYDAPGDPGAVWLRDRLLERGVGETVGEVCGLPVGHPLIGMIVKACLPED